MVDDSKPRSATIEQWEDADAQLVKAVARFSETSASLERQFTTRDESTYNLATRIDSSLHYLQKSMQKQIRSSKLALAKTRNRTARSILAIPGEVLSEIFLCFVYDPIHEEAASSLSISMERRVSIIYRRLYSLMGVCVSWRDVCLTCEALWSVVPLIDPGISLVKPLSTDLSLQRARGKGLYLAVFLPNNPHSRLEAMLGDLSRFTAINLHQKNHYSTESTPFIDLLAKILKSVEIKQLSQLSLGGISVVFGGGRGYTRPGPLLFSRPPLSGIEARFLRILRSLSALQLQGVVLDWKHMTFSNSLSTLRISGTSLGESGINLLISALSSASKLRNLELIAIRTLVINENKTQTQQLVFPELQSLYLGDLNFNVLRLLVEVIASGTYHLTLELTQALSTSYWSLSSGPSFYNSQSHHANEVHDILEIAPVNKLVLTGEEDCLWGDSSELQNLLRYTPRINTLILNGFRLDYATLRALRPIPRPRGWGPPGFPKLQTLEFHHAKLPGPLVYLKSGFEDLLDRQQIQRMVIGMRAHDSEYSACSVGEDEEFIHWLKTKVTKFYLSSEEVSDDMIDSDTWQLWNV